MYKLLGKEGAGTRGECGCQLGCQLDRTQL